MPTEYEKEIKKEKDAHLNKLGWTAEQMALMSSLPLPHLRGRKAEFARLYASQGFCRQGHAYSVIYPNCKRPNQEAYKMMQQPDVRLFLDVLRAREWTQVNITLAAVAQALGEIMHDVTISARDRVAAAAQLRALLMGEKDPEKEEDTSISLNINVQAEKKAPDETDGWKGNDGVESGNDGVL